MNGGILVPIKEESFRIGCGRYIQGKGYIDRTGEEVLRLGKYPLIIGGETALGITKEKLEESIRDKCKKYEFIIHTGTCNEERAMELSNLAKTKGYDVIVGVGGGVICDFAKLCSCFAELPIICIPTSSATCAAYTPLSVCYTPDGKTVGTKHYSYEVNCVIADTLVISAQPIRLFLAGVFDSLAKLVEIKHRFTEETEEYPIGLDYAYTMSKYSYKLLNSKVQKCINDMKNGIVSDDIENVVFTLIAATGVISGIARGSNQTALAHKFYETTRFLYPSKSKPYLHGELVGIGLLLQNHYNGETENNDFLIELMKKYQMPYRITDVGIDTSEEGMNAYYNKICGSSAIDKNNQEECGKLRESLKYLWSIR